MTNTIIFVIIALTSILLLGTSNIQAADHGDAPSTGPAPIPYPNIAKADAKAIPDWVKFNMQSYLNKQISERELLDAFDFLKKQGIMHESQEAALQMAELRKENTALKKKLGADGIVGPNTWGATDSPVDEQGRVKVQFHWDQETEQEALHHLRKAYDLNPAFQTKIIQFDKDHDKWIDVLSIHWGSTVSQDCLAAEGRSDENSSCWVRVSQVHASGEEIWTDEHGRTSDGDPDRPIITGNVPNPGQTGVMHLKGSKIHENAPADDRPTEEVAFYYNKISSASSTVHDLVSNGETSTTGWEEGVAAFTSKNYDTTTDGTHELGHALGMMNNAMEKEIQTIEGEVAILGDLLDMFTSSSSPSARATSQYSESDFQFISRYTSQIDTKIDSLQVGLNVLEDMMSSARNDRQLASSHFENANQKNQDTLDLLKAKTTQINTDGEFWFTELRPGS